MGKAHTARHRNSDHHRYERRVQEVVIGVPRRIQWRCHCDAQSLELVGQDCHATEYLPHYWTFQRPYCLHQGCPRRWPRHRVRDQRFILPRTFKSVRNNDVSLKRHRFFLFDLVLRNGVDKGIHFFLIIAIGFNELASEYLRPAT